MINNTKDLESFILKLNDDYIFGPSCFISAHKDSIYHIKEEDWDCHTCKENLLYYQYEYGRDRIIFSTSNKKDFASFIHKIEDVLKIKRTKFISATVLNQQFVLVPKSSFWRKSLYLNDLLAIMFRNFNRKKPENFTTEEDLTNYFTGGKYFKDSKLIKIFNNFHQNVKAMLKHSDETLRFDTKNHEDYSKGLIDLCNNSPHEPFATFRK